MSNLVAELLVDSKNALGEGIQWNEHTQRVYWSDIFGDALWSCGPNGEDPRKQELPGKLCAFAFTNSDVMLAAFSDGLYWFNPETLDRSLITAYDPENKNSRMNDGNLDRQGRFIVGGINEDNMKPTTPVWRVDNLGETILFGNVGCANSTCFSPDGTTMYFADSAGTQIHKFDYDTETGTPTNRRLFTDLKDAGIPDGSTVDAEGSLWNARFGGACVQKFLEDGTLDIKVELPVPNVTCCCIGGPNLDRLYITTARLGMSPDDIENKPSAGGLFVVDLPVKGLPHGRYSH